MADSENPTTPQPEKPTFWSPEHRIVFANAFALRMGNNDIAIDFSTEQSINGKDGYLSSTQIIMTPATTKLLAILLTHSLARFEKDIGPIALDQKKIDSIADSVASSVMKTS